MNYADDRAYAVQALAAAEHLIETDGARAVMLVAQVNGWSTWGCGEVTCTVPTMRTDAGEQAVERYAAHIEADLTGRCPLCAGVVGFSIEPEHRLAAWSVLPITLVVNHEPGCPAIFGPDDRDLFEEDAWN